MAIGGDCGCEWSREGSMYSESCVDKVGFLVFFDLDAAAEVEKADVVCCCGLLFGKDSAKA